MIINILEELDNVLRNNSILTLQVGKLGGDLSPFSTARKYGHSVHQETEALDGIFENRSKALHKIKIYKNSTLFIFIYILLDCIDIDNNAGGGG